MPAPGESADALYLFSLAVSRELRPGLRLGANHISLGTSTLLEGTRAAVLAGPYVEGYLQPSGPWEPFAGAGLPLQLRWGGGLDAGVGVAAYFGAGFRYRVAPEFLVGLEARLTRVLTEAFLFTPRMLPQGALPFSAGAALGFTF